MSMTHSHTARCIRAGLCWLALAVPSVASELPWEMCAQHALDRNPELIAARQEVNRSVAAAVSAASGLYPQISANADASNSHTDTRGSGVTKNYSYGVSGSLLLFDGFGTFYNVRSSSQAVVAAEQDYRATSVQTRYDARAAFVQLLRAQAAKTLSEEIIRIRSQNYDLVSMRYRNGLEHRGALYTAEANLVQARFQLAQSQRAHARALVALQRVLGVSVGVDTVAVGTFTVSESTGVAVDFRQVALVHPSVVAANAATAQADYAVRAAYARVAPEISVSGAIGRQGPTFAPDIESWNAGLTLRLPLFLGGQTVSAINQENSKLAAARARESATYETVFLSLADAWYGYLDTLEALVVQASFKRATEERAAVAEVQYKTNFITFDNWIIIQNDLVNAKKSYLDAQTNALVAEAQWKRSKGDTLEQDIANR